MEKKNITNRARATPKSSAPCAKMPNPDTMAAIEKMEKGDGKVYKDPDGLFKSWEKK